MKFEPIAYDHAARLINRRPWEISRNAGLWAEAQLAAMQTYGYDTSIVGVDIYNVEIEAYGVEILDAGGNGVPAAGDPIFDETEELKDLELDIAKGRLPLVLEAAEIIRTERPDADIRIPLSGPFTIACHLIGMENMICDLFSDTEETVEALLHLASNQLKFARMAVDKGFSISLFESSVTPPLLSPDLFKTGVVPALGKLIEGIKLAGMEDIQLIIGGNTARIFNDMCTLSASYLICPFETDQQELLSQRKSGIPEVLRVNMNPAVFLPGKMNEAELEAKRVLELRRQFQFDTIGTLVPFDADISIVKAVSAMVESIC